MKKAISLIVLFFVCSLSFSQKGDSKSAEEKAKMVTEEMSSVLDLNEEESKNVYEIHLEKFKSLAEASKISDKEQKKAKKKSVIKQAQNKFKELLSDEKYSKWISQKNKNKKKKKS